MSLNVVVPWDCTCCIPNCGTPNTGYKFVETLTKIEYLQFYFGEEITVNASYQINSRVDHPDPHSWITSTYQGGPLSDSRTVEYSSPGCDKSASWTSSETATATLTRIPRGGGSDEVYTGDFNLTVYGALAVSKSGSSFSLYADFSVSPSSGSYGAAFRDPPIASGPSTGGTIDFTAQTTPVSGASFGSDGLQVDAVYTSNSTATLSAVVALATPP